VTTADPSQSFRPRGVDFFARGRVSPFWIKLGAILAVAAAMRLVFFRGMFASDDVVYFNRALEISHGIWTSSNYIGAIRYGVNIPIAGAIALFGPSLMSAALVPLLCSIGEIALVAVLVRPWWGERTALYSSVLLSFLPLHVQMATSIHADPLLAFAITLTFVLFWSAESGGRSWLYFAAGLAAGYAYWIKEASVLFLLAFPIYAIAVRRWSWQWLYCAGGALLAFAANCALMWAVSGDPLHNLTVMHATVNSGWRGSKTADHPLYYFAYLFGNIQHVWLAGYLAAFGAAHLALRWRDMNAGERKFAVFASVWLAGLIAAFSFVPVSFSPLRFVMKQSNYMTIFLAPLAVMGAFGLSQVNSWARKSLLAAYVVGGFMLSALAQQDARAYVAAGQAAEAYAASHPGIQIYGTTRIAHLSLFHARLRSLTAKPNILKLSELQNAPPRPRQGIQVVIDREALDHEPEKIPLHPAPSCWTRIGTLTPIGYGAGATVVEAVISTAHLVPGSLGERLGEPFQHFLHPKLAEIFAVPPNRVWCR